MCISPYLVYNASCYLQDAVLPLVAPSQPWAVKVSAGMLKESWGARERPWMATNIQREGWGCATALWGPVWHTAHGRWRRQILWKARDDCRPSFFSLKSLKLWLITERIQNRWLANGNYNGMMYVWCMWILPSLYQRFLAGPDASCYSMSVGRRLEVGKRETFWIPGAVGVTGRFLDGLPCMVNVFSAVYHSRKMQLLLCWVVVPLFSFPIEVRLLLIAMLTDFWLFCQFVLPTF